MIKHRYQKHLYGIIKELRLTTSLNFVLDAADKASFDGSSQTWTDPVGANNFFRGTDGTSQTTDPTFAGTAGLPNEGTYFSFDGGDLFKQTAAHTFEDEWHKNNGAFTLVAVVYVIDGSTTRKLWDNAATGVHGVTWRVQSIESNSLIHSTSNAAAETINSSAKFTTSSWNFAAVSFDEATTAMSFAINSTIENPTPTGSTNTTAASTIRIGGDSDTPGSPLESGERMACIAGWSTKISDANLTEIYKRLKYRRFTSMP